MARYITPGNRLSYSSIDLGTTHSIALVGTFTANLPVAGNTGHYALAELDGSNVYYSAGSGNFVAAAHGGFSGTKYLVLTRSGTTVRMYKNGSKLGSDLTLGSNSALAVSEFGAYADGGFPITGNLAEIAFWDAQLTDAEVAALYQRDCRLIRSQSLIHYWPLFGKASPEPDIVGAKNATLAGSPTEASHPRIFYARRGRIYVPSAAPAGTSELTGAISGSAIATKSIAWAPVEAGAPTTVSATTASHSYTGQAPKLNSAVAAGVVTHSYTGRAPKLDSAVAAPVVTHTYTARAPRVDSEVRAGVATHTYTGQVPTIQEGGATTVSPDAVTHAYTGIAPRLDTAVAAGVVTHTYTARAPRADTAVAPGAASHTYTGVAPDVLANVSISVPVASTTYGALAPTIRTGLEEAEATGGFVRRKKGERLFGDVRLPTPEEVQAERERLGILPKRVQKALEKVAEREVSTAAADLRQAYQEVVSGDLQRRAERELRNELAARQQRFKPELPQLLQTIILEGIRRLRDAEEAKALAADAAAVEEREINEILALWVEM